MPEKVSSGSDDAIVELSLAPASDLKNSEYGHEVRDLTGAEVALKPWTNLKLAVIFRGSGHDHPDFVDRELTVGRQAGTVVIDDFRSFGCGGRRLVGRFAMSIGDPSSSYIQTDQAVRYPGGGIIYYPKTPNPYVLIMAVGDSISPSDFKAFYFSGETGFQVAPGVWHQVPFPVTNNLLEFHVRESRVFTSETVDFGSKLGQAMRVFTSPTPEISAALEAERERIAADQEPRQLGTTVIGGDAAEDETESSDSGEDDSPRVTEYVLNPPVDEDLEPNSDETIAEMKIEKSDDQEEATNEEGATPRVENTESSSERGSRVATDGEGEDTQRDSAVEPDTSSPDHRSETPAAESSGSPAGMKRAGEDDNEKEETGGERPGGEPHASPRHSLEADDHEHEQTERNRDSGESLHLEAGGLQGGRHSGTEIPEDASNVSEHSASGSGPREDIADVDPDVSVTEVSPVTSENADNGKADDQDPEEGTLVETNEHVVSEAPARLSRNSVESLGDHPTEGNQHSAINIPHEATSDPGYAELDPHINAAGDNQGTVGEGDTKQTDDQVPGHENDEGNSDRASKAIVDSHKEPEAQSGPEYEDEDELTNITNLGPSSGENVSSPKSAKKNPKSRGCTIS